jgi:hypothetical protein
MNPNNYKQVYVSDLNNKIWRSSDEGATWSDMTFNLPMLRCSGWLSCEGLRAPPMVNASRHRRNDGGLPAGTRRKAWIIAKSFASIRETSCG